jgi:hypothetical protein
VRAAGTARLSMRWKYAAPTDGAASTGLTIPAEFSRKEIPYRCECGGAFVQDRSHQLLRRGPCYCDSRSRLTCKAVEINFPVFDLTSKRTLVTGSSIDLYSRRVIGRSMKAEMMAQFVAHALIMAIGLCFGVQFYPLEPRDRRPILRTSGIWGCEIERRLTEIASSI